MWAEECICRLDSIDFLLLWLSVTLYNFFWLKGAVLKIVSCVEQGIEGPAALNLAALALFCSEADIPGWRRGA